MNLGLSILEINEIIELVDSKDLKNHSRYDLVEGDGKIDHNEFKSKLYDMPANEKRMLQRAHARLSLMKENMLLYMTSASDAFRMVSNLLIYYLFSFQNTKKGISHLKNLKAWCISCAIIQMKRCQNQVIQF